MDEQENTPQGTESQLTEVTVMCYPKVVSKSTHPSVDCPFSMWEGPEIASLSRTIAGLKVPELAAAKPPHRLGKALELGVGNHPQNFGCANN